MFIGHYAPALVAAAFPRAPRLVPLFVAAQLVDMAFFVFVLVGVEHMALVPGLTVVSPFDLYDMRWTHSLVGALGWAAGYALLLRWRGVGATGAWIAAMVVVSHWVLDLLVHAPDLTLTGSGPRYGFALWNHPYVEMPLELGITFCALVFYADRTRASGWAGRVSLAVLSGTLVVFQMVNWLTPQPTAPADPVPVSVPLTALFAYAVLTALAAWVAHTRRLA